MKKKSTLLVISFFIFFLLTTIYSARILETYANFFKVDNATKNADAILVLAGSPVTRPEKAIDLYRKGYSNKIYITETRKRSTRYDKILKSKTALTVAIFSKESIPIEVIPSKKGGATSTFDEAHDFANFVKANSNIKHVILVTDSFHTKRALYAFSKVFDIHNLDTHLEIAAANNRVFNESNWWNTESGLTAYILEPIKFIAYLFHEENII